MKEKNVADKYLTIQSVAETLSCTDNYVYELIRVGSLTAVKIGERALRVSERSLQNFLAARVVNPDNYFAPKETPSSSTPEPAPEKPKVAKSNWMNR